MKNNNAKLKRNLSTFNFQLLTYFRASRQNGYTLIEMIVVVALTATMVGISMYNYFAHKKDEILIIETQKVAQMLRRAQNLSLSPQLGGEIINGFGINVSTTSGGGTITLFKDIGSLPNYIYDGGNEKIEELNLDPNVKVSVLQAPLIDGDNTTADETTLNVLYIPPDPIVSIYNATGSTSASKAKIIIALIDDSKLRSIEFNLTGLVEVK